MLDPVGHLLQHSSRMIIVRLVSKTNTLWQLEAGQLETVFQGCNAHYEKRAQLRLPLTDVAP
jgi:hypothetical protein